MVHFPVKKCCQVAKICAYLLLVVTVLGLFEYWRGGKRGTAAILQDSLDMNYERQILEDEARIVPGLGEGGVPAQLDGEALRLGQESEKKLAMNVYLSDRIPYNRSLQDHRNPACRRVVYDAELPSASVVIIFHNEPYSVVVRTVWSVVNSARRGQPWYRHANYVERATGRMMELGYPGQDRNSPLIYLKEIILVDDNSTLPELKGKLEHYVRTRLPPGLIRILRLPERVGLTRARLAGARLASADALIFLDAHCEAQPDWLRPLLQRMKQDPHAVVMPIIDVIEADSFHYSVSGPESFQVGGFNFMGHFTWIDVNEKERKRRGSDIAPTWSPTMAGGLFAINRHYYWELGAYDEQMAGWGGENLEMSFRIWQCGGSLETVPCSRVGHVFRAFHPYGLPASTDTHGINTARMAEVWMDDYKELFYLHRPDLRNSPKIGDVTHRKVLREKLHCKSFQWYLDNIYPDKFVPVRDAYGFGRFKNPSTGLCLDSLQREGPSAALGVYSCHGTLQPTQHMALAGGRIRDEERCAVLDHASRDQSSDGRTGKGRRLLMVDCKPHKGEKWRMLPSKQLRHESSGLCLDAGWQSGADVLAMPCKDVPSQIWEIDYTEDNGFRTSDGQNSEIELALQKLRRQNRPSSRRFARSLLSYEPTQRVLQRNRRRRTARIGRSLHYADSEDTRRSRKRRKKHRKPKKRSRHIKDRFILKLVRTLNNGTDEHLEVDIHCKHNKLQANNTFVRDVVALLTQNDIKVINNGRVFERNKVSKLSAKLRHDAVTATTTTTTTTTTTEPMQVQPQLKRRQRYRAPSTLLEFDLDEPSTGPQATEKPPVNFIVEARRKRKHSRKHKRPSQPAQSPVLTSVEESPMKLEPSRYRASSSADDDNDEIELSGPTHARRDADGIERIELQKGLNMPMIHFEIPTSQLVNPSKRSGSEEPLQVVMRGNLSFNVGEEFFRAGVDELLDGLSLAHRAQKHPAPPAQPPRDSGGASGDSSSSEEME